MYMYICLYNYFFLCMFVGLVFHLNWRKKRNWNSFCRYFEKTSAVHSPIRWVVLIRARIMLMFLFCCWCCDMMKFHLHLCYIGLVVVVVVVVVVAVVVVVILWFVCSLLFSLFKSSLIVSCSLSLYKREPECKHNLNKIFNHRHTLSRSCTSTLNFYMHSMYFTSRIT